MSVCSKKIKIIFCLFALFFLFSNHLSFAAQEKNPKVLLFIEIDIYYLNDTIKTWGEKVGINGFLLTHIANWWTPREQLFENMTILKEVNQKGVLYGVDQNFIKVALGYKKLPDWTDDKAWAGVIDNFKNIAELIRQSGTRGIALDTEPYEIPFFNSPENPVSNIYTDFLKAKIHQRGKQIMEALEGVFPGIEVIILPEGAFYWFNPDQGSNPKGAELWIDFFNGFAAGRKKGRMILAAERTYSETDKDSILNIYNLIDKTMRDHVEDKKFWQEKCSIAIGMWPLGKSYTDKSARYSAEKFGEQFAQSSALSPEYIWIYDHGTAWYQLTNEETVKYTANNHSIWEKDIQVLPTDPSVLDYYRVVKTKGLLK
jgi:hypothetical protein